MATDERCQLRPDGTVLHLDCHTYIDNTITDRRLSLPAYIVTGSVRESRDPNRKDIS